MNNTKIIIEYAETIEIQRSEETKHINKEYDFIPLDIVKAIEKILDNYRIERK